MKIFLVNGSDKNWLVAADSAEAAKALAPGAGSAPASEIAGNCDGTARVLATGSGKLVVDEKAMA